MNIDDIWFNMLQRYPVGTNLQGCIIGVVQSGIRVEIEDGIIGYVNKRDFSWDNSIDDATKVYSIKDIVPVQIREIDPIRRRILGVIDCVIVKISHKFYNHINFVFV